MKILLCIGLMLKNTKIVLHICHSDTFQHNLDQNLSRLRIFMLFTFKLRRPKTLLIFAVFLETTAYENGYLITFSHTILNMYNCIKKISDLPSAGCWKFT